jgi:aryl-alcohol dehydrogenase-like predicted oxidoreductase
LPSATTPSRLRTLGRTGLTVPVVSVGTAYAKAVVAAALDAGMTYVHTSSSYAERNHERLLGEGLKGRKRDSFVLGTSPDLPARFPSGSDRSTDVGIEVNPDSIARSMDASLKLLGGRRRTSRARGADAATSTVLLGSTSVRLPWTSYLS